MGKPTKRQTAGALKDSILHWRRLERMWPHCDDTVGMQDCALCGLFHREKCRGCPIRLATDEIGCRGTPYGKAVELYEKAQDALKRADREDDTLKRCRLKEIAGRRSREFNLQAGKMASWLARLLKREYGLKPPE